MIKKVTKEIYYKLKKIIVSIKLKKILVRNKEEAIILIGSPLHGNIGDHAISIAERELLKKVNDKQIIEIPGEYYRLCPNIVKKFTQERDIIIITGGGFLGSLWLEEENMVRNIIQSFPQNRIVIMPQTIYFEENDIGREEFEKSKKIYENHKDLWLFLRENKSYQYCQEKLSGIKNISIVPDIVIYLNCALPKETREGVLFCLRKDKEKVISLEKNNELKDKIKKLGLPIKETTTVIKKRVNLIKRQEILDKKLLEFKRSQIVITDRLHGMIFCAITATPCIAMDNLSGKVKGVYEWLKDLPYINFIENVENISNTMEGLLKEEEYTYPIEKYREKLEIILKVLNCEKEDIE